MKRPTKAQIAQETLFAECLRDKPNYNHERTNYLKAENGKAKYRVLGPGKEPKNAK